MEFYFLTALLTSLVSIGAASLYTNYKVQQELIDLNATLKKLSIDTIKVGNEQIKGLAEVSRNTYRIR